VKIHGGGSSSNNNNFNGKYWAIVGPKLPGPPRFADDWLGTNVIVK